MLALLSSANKHPAVPFKTVSRQLIPHGAPECAASMPSRACTLVMVALVEPLPPKGFVWASISDDHTDGVMWDAGVKSDGTFQDFERECFGDDDACDYWFYGGPSQFTTDAPSEEPEHVKRITQIRTEGLAAIKARQTRERQQQEALRRLRAATRRPAVAG